MKGKISRKARSLDRWASKKGKPRIQAMKAMINCFNAKFFEGDLAGAQKLQRDTFEIFKYLFCEVNPIPVKKAVDLMGLNAGPLRMPLTEMTPANAEKLAQAMKK